jgi:formate dehydrogenase subunit beta
MDKSFAMLKTNNQPNRILSQALGRLLDKGLVSGVMAPGITKGSGLPMPMLFTRDEAMQSSIPLAPAAGVSAAVQAARIGRKVKDKRVAVVLKPCEVRGVVELAKLNQTSLESLAIISMECPGRMENDAYLAKLAASPDLPDLYLNDSSLQDQACSTCLSCDAFEPEGADITIHLFGLLVMEHIGISGMTAIGKELIEAMDLEKLGTAPDQRGALSRLRDKRGRAKEELFQKTSEILKNPDQYLEVLGNCLGCFNCRTACPLCYCRECVCARESFDRDLDDVSSRAKKTGQVRMPAGLSMFHMTRMVHMSHACVGCGQCSSYCPSKIPVADLFRTMGQNVQKTLNYSPGRNPEEPIPFLRFKTEAGS